MSEESVKGLIVTMVNTIKDAEYFIEQGVNTEYWKGQKSAAQVTIEYLRGSGLGFSVTEFINEMPTV